MNSACAARECAVNFSSVINAHYYYIITSVHCVYYLGSKPKPQKCSFMVSMNVVLANVVLASAQCREKIRI